MMTDLELALDAAEVGARAILRRFGTPIWCEPEDVFAQANVITLTYMNSERYQRSKAYTHAYTGLIDWLRHAGRRADRLIRDQDKETIRWPNIEPEEPKEEKSLMARLVATLDDHSRMIVEMVFILGLKQSEVAKIFDVSESAVSKKLRIIYSQLRQRYNEVA